MRSGMWRLCFLLGGLLCTVGGGMHPRDGDMAKMLADPKWVPSHTMLLVGLALVTWGLFSYVRAHDAPPRVRFWARLAVAGLTLEVIETVFHTLAFVDAAELAAGHATPVFTIHMAMAYVVYPIFGVTVAGFIFVAAAARWFGSRWTAPLGIIGALAYGAAIPANTLFPNAGLGILFPMFLLFAVWLLLTGIFPGRTIEPG